MRAFFLVIAISISLLLSSCVTKRWVDKKGRSCRQINFLLAQWDHCHFEETAPTPSKA